MSAPAYDWSVFSDAELGDLWRSHLDMAEENDGEGGHVGISRHHRRQARRIGDEMNLRRARGGVSPSGKERGE